MTQSIQLKKVIDNMFDGKQAALAKTLGKSAAQINQWLNGYRNISNGMALQIEQKLNLPFGWLNSEQDLPNDFINSINQKNYHSSEIQSNCLPNHSLNLQTIFMPDNSFAPHIPQGSKLNYDTNQISITNGKLYLIKQGERLFIRRVFYQISGSLKLVCDNKDFGDDEITPNTVQIIGRIVSWTVND